MSGAMAHFPVYDGHSNESNPPSVSRLSSWHAYRAFYFYAWIVMHILASLAIILIFTQPTFFSSLRPKDIFLIHIIISMDGIALLATAVGTIITFANELRILQSTISSLRASLRSSTADAASQSRYQLRASATIHGPEERDSNIDGEDQLSVAPSKLVAHADPNWMSDLQLEPSQSDFNNPKEVNKESAEEQELQVLQEKEAGESSATQNLLRGGDIRNKNFTVASGSRPSWVEDGTLCVVCHNPFGAEGAHMLGTCGHVFHPPCLVDYSSVKRHCYCDVPIDTRYYASICLQESMPGERRDSHGRSSLHGGFDWEIIVDR